MVKDIRGEKVESIVEVEIDLLIKGFIPNDYVPELNQRLDFYRRIQLAKEKSECIGLSREFADRFGPHPEPVKKLLALLEIRVFCQQLHINQVRVKNGKVFLTLLQSTPLKSESLEGILDDKFKMISEFQIGILLGRKNWRTDLNLIVGYLQKLSNSLGNKKALS